MFEPGYGRRAWILGLITLVVLVGAALWALSGLSSIGSSPPLPKPPSPIRYGTKREIGTRGDPPNPGALFHGNFPSDEQTQERRVGGLPARFSGYTTWVRSVTRVPARKYASAYPGVYLRVRVTVFNRDTQSQHVCACDFFVWTRTAGYREADVVAAPTLASDTDMSSGARRDGDVYLYVGTVPGPYYVVYNPDDHVAAATSTARGVWLVPASRAVTRVASPSTRSGPPSTPG
jgi:hypothetical protein